MDYNQHDVSSFALGVYVVVVLAILGSLVTGAGYLFHLGWNIVSGQ